MTLCQLPLLASRVQVDVQVTASNSREADERSCHVVQFHLKPLSTLIGKILLTLEFLLCALNKGPNTYKNPQSQHSGARKTKCQTHQQCSQFLSTQADVSAMELNRESPTLCSHPALYSTTVWTPPLPWDLLRIHILAQVTQSCHYSHRAMGELLEIR